MAALEPTDSFAVGMAATTTDVLTVGADREPALEATLSRPRAWAH